MAPYALQPSSFQPNQVGQLYHIGLGDGTRSYGYNFWNDGHSSQGLVEKSNVADKDKLIQYSSQNLIDRDFAYYPRTSQGDFSGGGLQTVYIDTTRYMDSDLSINTAGYVQLRSAWLRKSVNTTAGSNTNQVIAYNQDLYATFGEANGNVYKIGVGNASAPTSGSPVAASIVGIFTDGASLFAGTGAALYFDSSTGNLTTWGAIATSLNGTANAWWEMEQGTNGRFCYYTVRGVSQDSIYKIDLNAGRPVAPASQPQVPTGNCAVFVVDMAPYQGGMAILTTDSVAFNGYDVWYHDGTNMTRVIRVDGFRAKGMCSALGNLYVGCEDRLTYGGPILIQIGSGGYQVVAKPGVPNLYNTFQFCGQPRSNAEFVYWPVLVPGTPLTTGTRPRVLVYNTLTNAVSYLPNMDNTDFGSTGNTLGAPTRGLIGFGAGVAFAYQGTATPPSPGTVQYQQIANLGAASAYQTTGWMVSSKVDFQTPGITKRFRKIEVNHAPLRAGESITVRAFVDQDPYLFTPSLAPVPSTAQVTNNTVGSTVTLMTFGADTVGRSMYLAIQLGAGTGNQTTPRVIWTSVEIGGTWIWDFQLDCSGNHRRRTLAQQLDGQGVSGKDLYWLLRNSYENGNNLTLYLAGGLQYAVNVESLEGQSLSYTQHTQEALRADEEWRVHAVLRQVA